MIVLGNNICIKCRTSQKSETTNCPICKTPMIFTSHKFRAPKKRDIKGWKKFIKWVRSYNPYYEDLIKTAENTIKNSKL